ncbi:class II aldolase/adducin family protein [Albimonas pacifica]|uniref:L-fuculose 1-phosphate aldolase n=1 Tax=Albimonas pacifica TaxID=1114924 RepID=A0A1I3C3H5_9RHOB|nr:class II aldolase/adducin family protein [Albimonas pacifica]SFH68886.1 L-fuculose 1-phosphate aldolase [Albimonas pacifica]
MPADKTAKPAKTKATKAAPKAPTPAEDTALRRSIIDHCLAMNATGFNQGTSGNLSVRQGEAMLITPSGIPYATMSPEMIARMPLSGGREDAEGPRAPSSEWRFHRDILRARPEFNAVVHAHAPYATALAMTRRGIPASHYMVALFGGDDVRCADYATFGTQALSDAALAALAGRNACLLANHGLLACGPTLEKAMAIAVELEALARQHHLALQIGGPALLTPRQMADTHEMIRALNYGNG